DFPEIEIHPKHDRMHIVLNGAPFETIDQRLKLVFGIQTYSPTIKVDKNLDAIKKASLELMQATFKDGMTFKVNTRRSDHDFEYDTNQLNMMIGDYLFDNMDNLKVQMKKPDLVLRIEVRQDAIYISNQLLHGAGGMPVGTAGKDRKSTRLNSSHVSISYAVFCLKKKKLKYLIRESVIGK